MNRWKYVLLSFAFPKFLCKAFWKLTHGRKGVRVWVWPRRCNPLHLWGTCGEWQTCHGGCDGCSWNAGRDDWDQCMVGSTGLAHAAWMQLDARVFLGPKNLPNRPWRSWHVGEKKTRLVNACRTVQIHRAISREETWRNRAPFLLTSRLAFLSLEMPKLGLR